MIQLFKPDFGLNNYADKGTVLLRSCPDLLLTPSIKKHTREIYGTYLGNIYIWNIQGTYKEYPHKYLC